MDPHDGVKGKGKGDGGKGAHDDGGKGTHGDGGKGAHDDGGKGACADGGKGKHDDGGKGACADGGKGKHDGGKGTRDGGKGTHDVESDEPLGWIRILASQVQATLKILFSKEHVNIPLLEELTDHTLNFDNQYLTEARKQPSHRRRKHLVFIIHFKDWYSMSFPLSKLIHFSSCNVRYWP